MARRKITFDNQARLPFEEWEDEAAPVAPRGGRDTYARLEIKQAPRKPAVGSERLLNFLSLGSGSSGNSSYVGTERGGILIDAGVKADLIETSLKANGIDMKKIVGILLTHDHSDHVRYVYALLRAHRHMRLFCTNRVLNGLLRRHSISRRIKDYHTPLFKEIPFTLADLEITAFDVPHDGTDNMGFSISFDNRRFVIATDLGEVSERARHYMSLANYLVIEANYDLEMLRRGRYPEYLKARIQTASGHLDNMQTAAFLKEIAGNKRLEFVFLCHLSQDNNTPSKALSAARDALVSAGLRVGDAESLADLTADVQLMALPRFETSRRFVFRPPLA